MEGNTAMAKCLPSDVQRRPDLPRKQVAIGLPPLMGCPFSARDRDGSGLKWQQVTGPKRRGLPVRAQCRGHSCAGDLDPRITGQSRPVFSDGAWMPRGRRRWRCAPHADGSQWPGREPVLDAGWLRRPAPRRSSTPAHWLDGDEFLDDGSSLPTKANMSSHRDPASPFLAAEFRTAPFLVENRHICSSALRLIHLTPGKVPQIIPESRILSLTCVIPPRDIFLVCLSPSRSRVSHRMPLKMSVAI
ncbi:hypothetical protein B0T25DRAFT_129265 [Lasiosphaeria hispida]|uniref:Uncharacterized protein n=1 Tax=Lasiosphaeria hispida TaxID=260671 RepID=A0AAJ0HS00_9PEZI|nr:hypothetical protein B0T25DRAFT_129265 [Lasiosphaeria hispida]